MMTHVGEQAVLLTDAATHAAPAAVPPKGFRRTRTTAVPVPDASLSRSFEEASVPETAATQALAEASLAAAAGEATLSDALSATEEIFESSRDTVERSMESAAEPTQSVVEEQTAQLEETSNQAASLQAGASEPVATVAADVEAVVAPAVEAAASVVEEAQTPGRPEHPASTLQAFNIKLADVVRDHVEDSLSFFAALASVRSVPEAFTLNSQHLQRRMEAFTLQSRDLTILAGKLAAHAMTPFTPAAPR